MTEEEKEKSYLEELRKHADVSLKFSFYSMQRIDLLIISVSGAGIYACLEILKYLRESHLVCEGLNFKIVGIFFASAIILNFFGQWASFYANSNYYFASAKKIEAKRLVSDSKEKLEEYEKESAVYECKATLYTSFTKITNIASVVAMFVGIIYIIICICITF